MIAGALVREWLAHRYGDKPLDRSKSAYGRKALELNQTGPAFIDTFGQRQFQGFVGFVDIVGFSERVKGREPREVADYVKPFLQRLASETVALEALVDKTIGDEVMFVLPDRRDSDAPPPWLRMGQLLGAINDLQTDLGKDYPLRIGLSYGSLFLDRVEGEGYNEWTVFGNTVHLAKRLYCIPQIDISGGFGGAYGVLTSDRNASQCFDLVLGWIAGLASKMNHTVIENPPKLKGISGYQCALLTSKTSPEETDGCDGQRDRPLGL